MNIYYIMSNTYSPEITKKLKSRLTNGENFSIEKKGNDFAYVCTYCEAKFWASGFSSIGRADNHFNKNHK